METILSLDVSTVATGWCIYKGGRIFKTGAIRIKDSIDIHKRMVILRDEVENLINKYNPKIVLVEDVWLGKNPKTAKTLAKFCGIVEEVSYRLTDVYPVILENTKVKKFFKCSKKEILFSFMCDLLDLPPETSFKENNDSIDSIAQLLCYLHMYKNVNIREDKEYGYLYKIGDVKWLTMLN